MVYNLIVPDQVATEMINRYIDNFKKKIKTRTRGKKNLCKSIWVDSSVITAFGDFFETHPKEEYDGVRIVHGGYDNNDSSTLILVPTRPDPSVKGKHENAWGRLVSYPSKYEFSNFNLESNNGKSLNSWFRKEYRKQKDVSDVYSTTTSEKAHSESVWFDRCVFEFLKDTMRIEGIPPVEKIDGIRIHLAAYKDFQGSNVINFQRYKNQSTLILRLTKNKEDVSDAFIKYTNYYKNILLLENAYNHGQLCPTQCNN